MRKTINTTISLIIIIALLVPVCPEPAFALSQMMQDNVGDAMIAKVGDGADQITILDGAAIDDRYRSKRSKRWVHLVKAYHMVLSGESDTVMIPFVDDRCLGKDNKSGDVYLRSRMIPVPFSMGVLYDCVIKGHERIKLSGINLHVIDMPSLRCLVRRQDHNVISVSFFDGNLDGRRFIFSDDGAVTIETIAHDEQLRRAASLPVGSLLGDNGSVKKSRKERSHGISRKVDKEKTTSPVLNGRMLREPGVTYMPMSHAAFTRFCEDMIRGGTRNSDGTISVISSDARFKGQMITIDPRLIAKGLCVMITRGLNKRFKIVWYDASRVKIAAVARMDDQVLRSA